MFTSHVSSDGQIHTPQNNLTLSPDMKVVKSDPQPTPTETNLQPTSTPTKIIGIVFIGVLLYGFYSYYK